MPCNGHVPNRHGVPFSADGGFPVRIPFWNSAPFWKSAILAYFIVTKNHFTMLVKFHIGKKIAIAINSTITPIATVRSGSIMEVRFLIA